MLFAPTGRLGWNWDPFTEVRRMQDEMRRLFAEFEDRAATVGFPPVNLWVGTESVVVTAELPGVRPEDIQLSAQENALTIQGKREPRIETENVAWHRRESAYGSFSRTVDLPFRVDPDNVQARFVNGVLEVELQRPESEKPKHITITTH